MQSNSATLLLANIANMYQWNFADMIHQQHCHISWYISACRCIGWALSIMKLNWCQELVSSDYRETMCGPWYIVNNCHWLHMIHCQQLPLVLLSEGWGCQHKYQMSVTLELQE